MSMSTRDPLNLQFDMTFVGHACIDELYPFGGAEVIGPGSAVLFGSAVAARLGWKTAIVTRMNPADVDLAECLRRNGTSLFLTPVPQTTRSKVEHPSEKADERCLTILCDAGFFEAADVPQGLGTERMHLAGIHHHEFTLDFIRHMHGRGYSLSLDLQCLVRVIGPDRRVHFCDNPVKTEVAPLLTVAKLDVVEAEIMTGHRDCARAAQVVAAWGAREVLITEQAGATLAAEGHIFRQPFTNRTLVGRNGRGDTTISAYLCRRNTHGPEDSLRFAAALVSLKMETAGPFHATVQDVERRMQAEAR
jgi:sugar/nucleoside kinase (ribokinase family)